uniref:RRM domain-containing protein n=1 Tax=Xiphophorus couchianus TaxID=32473 RepID=A0A3B5LVG5_9TELE
SGLQTSGVETKKLGFTKRQSAQSEPSASDSHLIPPSPVVHVRGLCDAVVEADLVEVLEKFGTICYVMMMPFKRQALVEFDSLESAERCVRSGGSEPVFIANQQAFFNFSTSQRITRPTNSDDPTSKNKVLLLSIQNPLYPISTDVLYTVCNPVGNVQRIVIFKRNGIQAMVEYPYDHVIINAQKAKMALNGADIYSGCCTLKIEYARPNRLNVVRNDTSSWDYTKPFLLHRGPHCPLLPLPPNSRYRRSHEPVPELVSYKQLVPKTFSSTLPSALLGSSAVAMVSSLHPNEMNCSRLFNLFCLYGNVEKFFSVNWLFFGFGIRLSLPSVSRQQAVIPSQVFELADGSSSYLDFSLTRNNRFSTTHSHRNIIQPPTAVLHFYNAPPTLDQQQLLKVRTSRSNAAFISKNFLYSPKKDINLSSLFPFSSTLSGLLEFDCKTAAVEALIMLNHHQFRIAGNSNPFTIKLCFSTSTHL